MLTGQHHIATLKRIIKENDNVFRFIFHSENPINFKAGQFIVVNLPISEKRLQRLRSYSLANLNEDKHEIELCISRFEQGKASEYFFNTIQLGDSIEFKMPQGSFLFRENQEKSVFICTGTGIVPFRAMILQLQQEKYDFSKIHLVFGTRSTADLIYYEELKSILNNNFHVCLSREKVQNFHHGYVHNIYENLIDSKAHYYLCGWKDMIDEAKQNLVSKGISVKNIFEEFYG